MRLKIELDSETAQRLIEQAVEERRPVHWQAEVMLRRALGFPHPPAEASEKAKAVPQEAQPCA